MRRAIDQSPEIAGHADAPRDFDTLCRLYVGEIERTRRAGPLALAGWSMGGALAMRVGRLLEAAGRRVEWIALFDTVLVPEDERAMDFGRFVEWALTLRPAVLGAHGTFADSHERARRYAAEHGASRLAASIRQEPDRLAHELGIDLDYQSFIERQFEIQAAHEALMQGVELAAVDAPLHVFWAAEGMQRENWLALTRDAARSTEQTLAGHHDDLMTRDGNAQAIARRLHRPPCAATGKTDERRSGTTTHA